MLTNKKTGYHWSSDPGFNLVENGNASKAGEWVKDDPVAELCVLNGLEVSRRIDTGENGFKVDSRIYNRGPQQSGKISSFGPIDFVIPGERVFDTVSIDRRNFVLNRKRLEGHFSIAAGHWNDIKDAGLLILEDVSAHEYLFIGVCWEREWTLSVERVPEGTRVWMGLDRFSAIMEPGGSIEVPTVFFGTADGALDDAFNKLHRCLKELVLLPQPPDFPWAFYDIWSMDAEGVEEALLAEAGFAQSIGVELLYYDAAWWAFSSVAKDGWGRGIGSYDDDRRKFPDGLRAFSDAVHKHGMKFGLWVDPTIIDRLWADNGQIPEKWLIREGGEYVVKSYGGHWPDLFQLCTGCPEAVEYIIEKLTGIVERFNLDYIKWDDSAFALPHCTRDDHGHQAGNGNYSACGGKYKIWAALIERFPDLILEECGGPARLDYGLAPYARANWLSDHTTPSLRARMNVEASSYLFPGSFCLTQIFRDDEYIATEDPSLLDTYMRSRMMGGLGMGTYRGTLEERVSLFPQPAIDAIKRNITDYKAIRHLLKQDIYRLSLIAEKQWQAVEYVSYDGEEAVVFAFRNFCEDPCFCIKPRGLREGAVYNVKSFAKKTSVVMDGSELMRNGINVELTACDYSEMLYFWVP